MTDERVAYAQIFLAHEFEPIGVINFYSPEEWTEKFLNNPAVDPTGAHKKYGLTAPQHVKERWWIGVCPTLLVSYAVDADDKMLQRWLEYWLAHLGTHLVILDWAHNLGEKLSIEEVEARVIDLLQELNMTRPFC